MRNLAGFLCIPIMPPLLDTVSEEELDGALQEAIRQTQALARALAAKRGTPVEEQCSSCKGTGKGFDLFKALIGEKCDENGVCEECDGKGVRPKFFPRYIAGINYEHLGKTLEEKCLSGTSTGDFVSVRPCDEECEGKTYLGVFLGNLALSMSIGYDAKTMTLFPQHTMHNPAMWVPELKRIVMGCGSWWGEIKNPEDLKNITNQDIENVWYVQALNALSKDAPTAKEAEEAPPAEEAAPAAEAAEPAT